MFFFTGHINYVTSLEEQSQYAGSDITFFIETILNPLNLILILGAIVLTLFIAHFVTTNKFCTIKIKKIIQRANSYRNLTSWMMRLSLGISLIGSGAHQSLISPTLPNFPQFSLLQIALGFFILTGFLLTPAYLLTIVLFTIAITKNPYLIGNLDLIALSIAALIISNPIPGLDHLLGLNIKKTSSRLVNYAPLILRLGIGTSMIFLAFYEKFLNPHLSQLVVTKYHMTEAIPVSSQMWVFGAGTVELLLGFLFLIGFKTRLISAIAFIVLSGSFFFFNEDVYSHVTLFGLLSVLFITGAGIPSLDKKSL